MKNATTKSMSAKPRKLLRKAALAAIFCLAAGASLFLYASFRLGAAALPVSKPEQDLARAVYARSNDPAGTTVNGAPALSRWQWLNSVPESSAAEEEMAKLLASSVYARSAILVDASTGEILFEKNADERIPPASMTKLAAMYTAFHAAENGEISFDDVVSLPPESWAENIPAGSSLMFLGKGQKVTVRELLLGMAVVSGNDAAIALASHVSGSVPAFVARMNDEMLALGLKSTHFVEPSGLSEENLTTAREFASFSVIYLRDYPQALRAFHSQTSLSYPGEANLPADSTEKPIRQNATNHLLGILPGCDGLKTGFIYESGYNLSLTAERNGTRFISVTMGGPGNGANEGNAFRNSDGTTLMEWAFANFTTVRQEESESNSVIVWGGNADGLRAIPAAGASFTAPVSALANSTQISKEIHLSKGIRAPIQAGDPVGRIDYSTGGRLVHSVPLIADRGIDRAGFFKTALDRAAEKVAALID